MRSEAAPGAPPVMPADFADDKCPCRRHRVLARNRFHACWAGGTGGFTLMEILVAMFVFSIVVSTVFLSHRSIFSSVGPMTDEMAVGGMARAFLGRLATDIDGAFSELPPQYAPPAFNAPPHPYRFTAVAESVAGASFPRLRFASSAHVPLSEAARGGIAEIIYFVEPDTDGTYTVRRFDRLLGTGATAEEIHGPAVCRGLREWSLTFYDAEGRSHDEWDSESKDSGTALPASVGVRFVLGGPDAPRPFETRLALNVIREPLK
ncbi:MAG: prepilin-type N-terminal cleavage/methylation domain-containing protein [Pseudomonadota bacterium]